MSFGEHALTLLLFIDVMLDHLPPVSARRTLLHCLLHQAWATRQLHAFRTRNLLQFLVRGAVIFDHIAANSLTAGLLASV
jgi:hypothetical protein